jgi:hypothetical protein
MDAARAEFNGAKLAALLQFGSAVFDYDEDVHGVIFDGAYLGVIDGNTIVFPALDDDLDGQPESISVDELEADGPAEPIQVHRDPDTGAYSIR